MDALYIIILTGLYAVTYGLVLTLKRLDSKQ